MIDKFKDIINSVLGSNNEEEHIDIDAIDIHKEYLLPIDDEYNQPIDTFKIPVSFVNESNNPNPEYATEGSSGFDLRAYLDEPIVLNPSDYTTIPTGLYFKLPPSFEMQIRSRSGLAHKNGVCVLNSPGSIDNDYTGEIKVILINHGKHPFTINNGDRIAQAVIATVLNKNVFDFRLVDTIEETTERGSNGFGSTGIA